MRRSPAGALLLAAAAAAAAQPAAADWVASGRFEYVDREFGLDGFTGVEPPRPVRWADVEVVDANRNGNSAIRARGSTDANGDYTIFVPDNKVRDVYVRAVTRSDETPDLHIDVRRASNGPYYAAATGTVENHAPGVSVDFGPSLVEIGQGAEAFNIYDQLLVGMDHLALLNGQRPGNSASLSVIWGYENGTGAAYYAGGGLIILRDTASYDDTVILHEMGHYAVQLFSATASPGGSHGFAQCDQDLRLAFDEGFATFWGNSALRTQDAPTSHVYLRSNGAPGPGNAVRTADLEADGQYYCKGSTSEVNVFMMLWDVVDGAATRDGSPGVEEDHDFLSLDDVEVWEVMTGSLPGSSNASLEDFWDGWFLPPVANGFRVEMIDLARRLGIDYREDPAEPDDTPGEAGPITTSGVPLAATFFRDPDLDGAGAADVDHFEFWTSAGRAYEIETVNLASDANTVVEILDADGQTVLAANDDRAADDESSRLVWTAPEAGRHYVRVTHAPDLGLYGSYQLIVRPTVAPPAPRPTGAAGSTPFDLGR